MKFGKVWAFSALALAALIPFASQAQQTVRVGSKNFTEQFVLAEIYAQALEAAGIKTEKKLNRDFMMGGACVFPPHALCEALGSPQFEKHAITSPHVLRLQLY